MDLVGPAHRLVKCRHLDVCCDLSPIGKLQGDVLVIVEYRTAIAHSHPLILTPARLSLPTFPQSGEGSGGQLWHKSAGADKRASARHDRLSESTRPESCDGRAGFCRKPSDRLPERVPLLHLARAAFRAKE